MRKWRLALIASTLSLILLMSVSLILHFAAIANNVNAAANTYTITVRKNEAVSVYVTGIGVTYDEDSSSTANDIYHCEINTEYTLTAVNEKKIFIGWELTDNDGKITKEEGSKCDITATKDLTVKAEYRDPVADDYGMYMGNRFIISGVDELIALQQIIAWGNDFDADVADGFVGIDDVDGDWKIFDVGPETSKMLDAKVENAKTVLWNGPLGVFELTPFDRGTNELAKTVAKLTSEGKLTSVAGGGDTVSALNNAGVANDFSYISTAGGAFLEWLEGKTLPAIPPLMK